MNTLAKAGIFYCCVLLLLFTACSDKNNQHADDGTHNGHQHPTAKATAHPEAEAVLPSELNLNAEQLKRAELTFGKLAQQIITERVSVSGEIGVAPNNFATVSTMMPGIVKNIYIYPGDYVVKGKIIAEIQHPEIFNLQENYLTAKTHAELTAKELQRQTELAAQNVGFAKKLQQAEADHQTAQANLTLLSQKLKLLGIVPLPENPEQMRATLTISAPISGYVTEIKTNLGKYIEMNAPIADIVDHTHLHLHLQVYENDLDKIKEGQSIIFQPSFSKQTCKGEVIRVGHLFSAQNRSVELHGHVTDPAGVRLLPGMFINGYVLCGGVTARVVSDEAIITLKGKNFLLKEIHQGAFEPVEVRLGNSENGLIAVHASDGRELNGERWVLKGAHRILASFKKETEPDDHGHGH